MFKRTLTSALLVGAIASISFVACDRGSKTTTGLAKNAAEKVYVAPGKLDEFYAFLSGGFSGQLPVYALPSGRLLKIIPVFSQHAENGYGYSEETKKMLETSNGFVPWDDLHHVELSMTNGVPNGKWVFVNSNNTPRIARVGLDSFRTEEIIEVPHSGGNHGSPFSTYNGEYLVASTRFGVPVPQKDVPISSYKENFSGTISFVGVDQNSGRMNVAFQLIVPGIDYDLGHCGKGPSKDWCFFTSYNSEEAHNLLEINASKNDKDLLAAVNWKKAEACVKNGKAKDFKGEYTHNYFDHSKHTVVSKTLTSTKVLRPEDCEGMIYYIPVAKSPHGSDVDPTGQYFVAGGKLASQVTAYSYDKLVKAIADKKITTHFKGIPVLDYESVMAGEVQKICLGPLHTEFDDKGYAYTSCFISSEVVKWKVGTWEVVDRIETYYALGHLTIPGGDSAKPWGKYLIAMNKITKDRYLPVGTDLPQAAQLIDISGEKMEMLLDFPTIGEPHYAQAIPASLIMDKVKRIDRIEDNNHEFVTKKEKDARVVRQGNDVHVYMTAIRSHLMPDNIEGVKVGDTVYFHVTNIEQDWDIAHGFAVFGGNNAELLLTPGETATLKFIPKKAGIYPFYCTDFCSALHQEMQGYLRVSEKGSNVPLWWSTSDTGSDVTSVLKPKAKVQMTASKGIGPVKKVTLSKDLDQARVNRGKNEFEAKCTACHKIDKRFVGPEIKGVTERRQPEWIMNMILNPTEMTKKDEVAKALLEEYASPMAEQGLSQEDARDVLEYFRSIDK